MPSLDPGSSSTSPLTARLRGSHPVWGTLRSPGRPFFRAISRVARRTVCLRADAGSMSIHPRGEYTLPGARRAMKKGCERGAPFRSPGWPVVTIRGVPGDPLPGTPGCFQSGPRKRPPALPPPQRRCPDPERPRNLGAPRWTPQIRPVVDGSKPASGEPPQARVFYLGRVWSGKSRTRIRAIKTWAARSGAASANCAGHTSARARDEAGDRASP